MSVLVATAMAAIIASPAGPGVVVDTRHGNDATGIGTLSNPFLTVSRALVAARAAHQAMPIVLRGGVHILQDPIVLMPSDNGLVLESHLNESATLSGGIPLSDWKPHATVPNLFQHAMPSDAPAFARQLWVDGARANRTRAAAPPVARWWASTSYDDAYETDEPSVLEWRNPGDVELIFHPRYPARGGYTEHRCPLRRVSLRTEL